jgi:hypothetical protein
MVAENPRRSQQVNRDLQSYFCDIFGVLPCASEKAGTEVKSRRERLPFLPSGRPRPLKQVAAVGSTAGRYRVVTARKFAMTY